MTTHRAPTTTAVAMLGLLGCGPTAGDLDDVYPRNCGIEGPVELFETDPMAYVAVRRAGDHYLIEHSADLASLEHWAVDRCAETQVLLHAGPLDDSLAFGAAGDHLLSCDEATGAVAWLDPTGFAAPRPLFPSVEECRVVPLGKGLAAQQKGGGTVWFHPDPTDSAQPVVVVTRTARIVDRDWTLCPSLDFDCDSSHPFGIDIRTAGEELLIALENDELLAFSSTLMSSRIVDSGPLFAMDVLPGGDRIVVTRHIGPTLIVDRKTGVSFEFGNYSDFEPIQQLGDWLVQGQVRSPVWPEPDQWTNFEAHHLPSGARTVIEGREDWSPFARLTADTVLADIGPVGSQEEARYVVWPATGQRQRLDLPGDETWTVPGRDGVFASEPKDDGAREVLRHLAGPGQEPRILLEDIRIAFATQHGRIVFERAREPGEPTPLSVMLPDERVEVLDEGQLGAFGVSYYSERWPIPRDEVLYLVADGSRVVLRRTVLP